MKYLATEYMKTAYSLHPALTGAGIGAALGLAKTRFLDAPEDRNYTRSALIGGGLGAGVGGLYAMNNKAAPGVAAPGRTGQTINDLSAPLSAAREQRMIDAHNKSLMTQIGIREPISRSAIPAGYSALEGGGQGWINDTTGHVLAPETLNARTGVTTPSNLGGVPVPTQEQVDGFRKHSELWATEYMKLAYVGEPAGYGKSMLGGAGIGAGLGALAGGLVGPKPSGAGALVGAGLGGLLGAGAGALNAHASRVMADNARAFESLHPTEQAMLLKALRAHEAGIPISPDIMSKLDKHAPHLVLMHPELFGHPSP